MTTYLLIAPDFVETGGMDVANHAFAAYLARRGDDVHLVGYRADAALTAHRNVTFHRIPKPANAYVLGGPFLASAGLYHSMALGRKARVLANGGNCPVRGVNWVHYVHSAHSPSLGRKGLRSLTQRIDHQVNLLTEKAALTTARVVIANSEYTRRHLIELVGIPAHRVQTIYYGIEGSRFRPPTSDERAASRAMFGWEQHRFKVAFVGGLGDRRKGFDVLFGAWTELCRESTWDCDLVVIGQGAELPKWRERAITAGLDTRIQFLGFRSDVSRVLAGCDAFVAPTRYEAYGLAVHEALCSGLPAIVSADAGVAERYPPELRELLLSDVSSVSELVQKLRNWRARATLLKSEVGAFANVLRARTWDEMAEEIRALCEAVR